MKKGFSLIELLVSLIVISIITAAFAPVMTKKLKNQSIISSSSSIAANCSKFDKECLVCTDESCAACINQFSVEAGYYVNPAEGCEVKECPNGCLACNIKGCTSCKEGYGYDPVKLSCTKCEEGTYSTGGASSCLLCSAKTENCSRCDNVTGVCMGCSDGYNYSANGCTKAGDCVVIGDICVQKYNAGDTYIGGLEIPDGLVVKFTPTQTGAVSNRHSDPNCWIGNGANQTAGGCDSINGDYSGCYRTLCTWSAANKICEYYGMRLPTRVEGASFLAYSANLGNNGLQLCNSSPRDESTSRCGSTVKCPGSVDGYCYPYSVWTGEGGTTQYYSYQLETTSLASVAYWTAGAFGVRCVRDIN